MQSIDQLQSAIVHLMVAMNLLDNMGADASAAKVSSAIESLKAEKTLQESWEQICAADWTSLDKMIDSLTNDSSILRIATLDGKPMNGCRNERDLSGS